MFLFRFTRPPVDVPELVAAALLSLVPFCIGLRERDEIEVLLVCSTVGTGVFGSLEKSVLVAVVVVVVVEYDEPSIEFGLKKRFNELSFVVDWI